MAVGNVLAQRLWFPLKEQRKNDRNSSYNRENWLPNSQFVSLSLRSVHSRGSPLCGEPREFAPCDGDWRWRPRALSDKPNHPRPSYFAKYLYIPSSTSRPPYSEVSSVYQATRFLIYSLLLSSSSSPILVPHSSSFSYLDSDTTNSYRCTSFSSFIPRNVNNRRLIAAV